MTIILLCYYLFLFLFFIHFCEFHKVRFSSLLFHFEISWLASSQSSLKTQILRQFICFFRNCNSCCCILCHALSGCDADFYLCQSGWISIAYARNMEWTMLKLTPLRRYRLRCWLNTVQCTQFKWNGRFFGTTSFKPIRCEVFSFILIFNP